MASNQSTGEDLIFPLSMLHKRPEKTHEIKNHAFLEDLRISAAHVVDGQVQLDLEIQLSQEDVLVSGKVSAKWSGECRRCIEEVSGVLDLAIDEVFRAGSSSESQVKFEVEDAFPFKEINGEQIVDLEEVVIGAMMIDKRGVDEIIDILKPETFYKQAHQYIYDAIIKLFNNGEPVDLLTVSQQLKKDQKLEAAGGDFYLVQLTQKVSSSAHIEFHARIILQKYIQRSLIKISNEIINKVRGINRVTYDISSKPPATIEWE